MDVKESEWVAKAIENITRYLNRGGKLKGDEPQRLGGTELLNVIGVAMGFQVQDPQKWTENELKKALSNNLVYFDGDARKAIDVISGQIRERCDGADQIFMTVLPVELYYNGKLYELPLFRVHRSENSKKYYVDNIGRFYDSVSDWYDNSKLPPCKMAYPLDLQLKLAPGHDYALVLVDDTPPARVTSKVVHGVDIATSVVGIASCVGLIFVSGGLATPLVAAGVAAAVWGTGRAGQALFDKASHGQDINPFTDSESRMLWLGIAANIVSFGAMGASMRLTSLVIRGQTISTSLRALVNIVNGTNIAVSGVAILDATIFMINNYDALSPADILMQVASIAFWTKGAFTYRTAGTLIKKALDHSFTAISHQLNQEEAATLSTIRSQFNNDAQLLKEFHRAAEANISFKTFSQIVIDAHQQGQVQFDREGNLVFGGGQKYSFVFLSKLPRDIRQEYLSVITKFRPDQMELFESFRQKVNNDMNLITGLHKVAMYYQLSPQEATEQVLSFWSKFRQTNVPSGMEISITEDNLVLGRAPPLPLTQLRTLSAPMIRFISEHLVSLDESISRQWTASIPAILHLENLGMFSQCEVTRVVPTGRAVVLLNDSLQISIYKLMSIDANDCESVLNSIGRLPANVSTANVPKGTMQLVNKFRLRLECQRREVVQWTSNIVDERLLRLIKTNLQSFEQDRLFTFKSTVDTAKAMPYMAEMMNYVAEMEPRNISEMVAYGEYVVTFVETQKRGLEADLRNGTLRLPPNTKKADFLRQKASEAVFENPSRMLQNWERTVAIVRENGMVGVAEVTAGLGDEALVAAVRGVHVGFGSEPSAAYHVLKHPTSPVEAYVQRANEAVREATRWQVTLTQDGDARLLRFESAKGDAILLERDGRVLLATFSPKKS